MNADARVLAPMLHDAIRDRIQGLTAGSGVWIDVDPADSGDPDVIHVEATASGRTARYTIRIEPED